ncbi:hypothetical protein [Saccharothrix syringae]|uniref:Transcriptional regulator n=1 Tax=Saccharothrix syringae TaxID=103733 RepID=A0A5Q0H0K3_SACSY|nr:hypothetical protein [Saccharothrix syringae]QFZ19767.1 transcriptional regulator [Saccharothrix syringae]
MFAKRASSRKAGDPKDRDVLARIGKTDVEHLEAATRELRRLDYHDGGGACREALRAEVAHGHRLLRVHAAEPVRGRLLVAVADLHNLAGWAEFDAGRRRSARNHHRTALELLTEQAEHDLTANVCYRSARLHLHRRDAVRALRDLERGRASADLAGSPRTSAIVSANQAWAHAMLGAHTEALALLHRAEEEFAAITDTEPPPWAAFFDATDLRAMTGVVHTELARSHDIAHTRSAMPALETAIGGYGDGMRRSRVFSLIALALNHLLVGDHDSATRTTFQAMVDANGLASTRVADRMLPLLRHCERNPAPTLTDLAHRLRTFIDRTRPPRGPG